MFQSHLLQRRTFLQDMARGLSSIALVDILSREGRLLADEPKPPFRPRIDPAQPYGRRQPQFSAAAKRVLLIFCSGACSQVDTWDYKPELLKRHGQPRTPRSRHAAARFCRS